MAVVSLVVEGFVVDLEVDLDEFILVMLVVVVVVTAVCRIRWNVVERWWSCACVQIERDRIAVHFQRMIVTTGYIYQRYCSDTVEMVYM